VSFETPPGYAVLVPLDGRAERQSLSRLPSLPSTQFLVRSLSARPLSRGDEVCGRAFRRASPLLWSTFPWDFPPAFARRGVSRAGSIFGRTFDWFALLLRGFFRIGFVVLKARFRCLDVDAGSSSTFHSFPTFQIIVPFPPLR